MNALRADEFKAEALPPGRHAVMFTADWCGYCRRFLVHFKALREAYLVDVSDEDDPLWDAYELQVVPTVIVFEDGKPVQRWQGVLAQHHVQQVKEALG